MMLEGAGFHVIDLGVDLNVEKLVDKVEEIKPAIVGLSALLTTTMLNMETISNEIKKAFPEAKVFLGGAPLSSDFNEKIGADGYFKDPYQLIKYLNKTA